jgi:hypothetical protein
VKDLNAKDYACIRAWGKMMGSYRYYIQSQISLARAEGAPDDAIYRRQDGTWARLREVENSDTKRWVENEVGIMKAEAE